MLSSELKRNFSDLEQVGADHTSFTNDLPKWRNITRPEIPLYFLFLNKEGMAWTRRH